MLRCENARCVFDMLNVNLMHDQCHDARVDNAKMHMTDTYVCNYLNVHDWCYALIAAGVNEELLEIFFVSLTPIALSALRPKWIDLIVVSAFDLRRHFELSFCWDVRQLIKQLPNCLLDKCQIANIENSFHLEEVSLVLPQSWTGH